MSPAAPAWQSRAALGVAVTLGTGRRGGAAAVPQTDLRNGEILPATGALIMNESRGFLGRAWAVQHAIEKRFRSIGKGRYARVLRMARKPEPQEYRHTANVVLIGIAVVGVIGFLIFMFMEWFLRIIGAV